MAEALVPGETYQIAARRQGDRAVVGWRDARYVGPLPKRIPLDGSRWTAVATYVFEYVHGSGSVALAADRLADVRSSTESRAGGADA